MVRKIYGIMLGFIVMGITGLCGVSTLSDSEKAFYVEYQDAFVQKTFVDDPENKLLSPTQLLADAAVFVFPTAIGIMIANGWREEDFTSVLDSKYKFIGMVTGCAFGLLCLWIYTQHCSYDASAEAFAKFLRGYEGVDGLKAYVSPSLIKTFDTMFQEYQKEGEGYFASDRFDVLVTAIQKQITKDNRPTFDRTIVAMLCLTAVALVGISIFTYKVIDSSRSVENRIDYWGRKFLWDFDRRHRSDLMW